MSWAGSRRPPPPPHSWASRPDADVAIWHLRFEPGARWTMPKAKGADTVRTLYLFEGGGLVIDGTEVGPRTGVVVRSDVDVDLESPEGTDVLVLQGRPIGEPVARYGPFVMNEEHEIEQAFADYRETQFGGWPWPSEEPVHTHATGRFAKRPDGTVEEPGDGVSDRCTSAGRDVPVRSSEGSSPRGTHGRARSNGVDRSGPQRGLGRSPVRASIAPCPTAPAPSRDVTSSSTCGRTTALPPPAP